MNQALPREIRGVLITVSGGRLLLPNASVSEVITMSTPEPVEGSPDWMLGRVNWRGWRVPLVSFPGLVGWPKAEGALNSRVAIIKALGGNPRMPFFAMVTQGFPRLTALSDDVILPTGDPETLPEGISTQVMVRDDEAYIPDLGTIERKIAEALESV
ncbi:chemotaxis protein CheW [Oleiagrimonas soli]|uniref:Chemosensory pili system protein ChpC n=1 Tax=Oleiagrimonas soli TaxID=1543381 RepID=A0A099D043_9GAMM|nr:chemotaxis protein CheW [Oleiagrimonas soli]KGI78630.1 chemotaxis protein CheW [Oleiagrimonas soli]MBB6184071.1 chemosensory pili system protein ChpC [Oleiagrimonas soli]